jgi:predicted DNA-binding transcriptional regulator AlpA
MSHVEMPQNGESPLLIPVEAVASLLSISKRSVWRRVSSGEMMPPIKLGDNARWRRQEIIDWVAAGCPNPNSGRKGK